MSLSYNEKDLFTMLLTIGGGSDASKGLERLVELREIVVSHHSRYLFYGTVGGDDELLS